MDRGGHTGGRGAGYASMHSGGRGAVSTNGGWDSPFYTFLSRHEAEASNVIITSIFPVCYHPASM